MLLYLLTLGGFMRVTWARVLAATMITATAGLAVATAPPAHAVGGLIGICQSPVPGQAQGCMKETSTGATKSWPRDISGDTGQQFNVTFLGVGFCGAFPHTGAFAFQSRFDGKYIGAAFKSGGLYYVGGQRNQDAYSVWAWETDGVLENCGDTEANAVTYLIQGANFYQQYNTAAATLGLTFQQVDPPARHR